MSAMQWMRRGRKVAGALGSVNEVLFLEYRLALGCCVHMTPVFETLKRQQPDLRIAVATRGLGLQVLQHSPFVDELIATADPLTDLPTAVGDLRRELRARRLRPDCVLTGASDQRTRIALLGMFGASSGWRGGYTQSPSLYRKQLRYDDTLSLIGNNLRLATLVGQESEPAPPRVFFSERDLETAKALLREANPDGRPVVVFVTQTSGGQSTGWHSDRFVEVIRAAVKTYGCAVLYVGTATDARAISALSTAAGGLGSSIAGRTTITELAATLALSDVVVTLDTGTMHVGRAVGTPMVVLAPSWQKPTEWLPLNIPYVRILRGEDSPQMPAGYQLDEISSGDAIKALAELLRDYPASVQGRAIRVNQSLSNPDHVT